MSGAVPSLLGPEDLRGISDLGLIARWIVEGTITGLHRSPFHGFSIEFAEYREYTRGDDLRYFDWKVFGRSDRHYIKKFHSETNLQCHLVVDASASMAYGDPSKFHYARCLAAAVAYVLEGQQDAVGLTLVDESVRRRLPPAVGPSHLQNLYGILQEAEPLSATAMAPVLHELAEAISRRGLVTVISDLYDDEKEILRAIQHLRFKGHEVLIFHLLDPLERSFAFDGLVEFEDLETGERIEVHGPTMRDEYRRRVEAWLGEIRSGCEAFRADYRAVDTSEPFAVVLADYLHRRRLWRAPR